MATRGMGAGPDDRRRNVITISARGRAHLSLLDRVLDDLHDELLAPLSPAERDAFTRALTRLLDHRPGAAETAQDAAGQQS